MTISSPIDLGLPVAPLSDDPSLNGELTIIYNALKKLQQVLSDAGINPGGGGSTTSIYDVEHGGTGVGTLTGLVRGNGTSPFTSITTSASLASVISDETGAGSLVFATGPVLVAPTLTSSPVLTTPKFTPYTVATLPVGAVGMNAYVIDALAPAYLAPVIGGGAVVCPVFYNGVAWVAC
jgi:hypothetical protein